MKRPAALVALCALLALGPGGAQGAPNVPPSGPSHCTGGRIRAALADFTLAFDRGDEVTLDALFAPEPDFQWYSTPRPGRRMNGASMRRGTLGAYFRARHRAGDHLRLTHFRFNGNGAHWGNFTFTTRRSADDFRGGAGFVQGGKGAAVCDDAGTRFIVLTFGRPDHAH